MSKYVSDKDEAMEKMHNGDDKYSNGVIERIESNADERGEYASITLRHGEKPKPSKNSEVGVYPRTSTIYCTPEVAAKYKIGQRVSIELS